MSGFAAIIQFDGRPVEPGQIEAMTQAMAYRGPDGIAHWTNGPVALGHGMLHTTAESLEETQPLANEDASLVLVMDGYLTNWEELRNELLTRGARLRTRSDAELVLRAYEAWGDDCPKHIDGEYSFLIWDSRRREAFCARDHAGLRPLHYAWNGRRLTVASDIAGVLADREVPRKPNYGMFAERIANEWLSLIETLWEDVLRLKPAHWMRVSAEGIRTERYWSPPLEATISYARDEDYFAHYRDVLQDSVRRASRTHLPLGCEVSGGLDSSAIFCVADRMLKTGQLLAPDLKGYTYLFEPGGAADEIRYARAVAEYTGRAVREVEPFMPDLEWFSQRTHDDLDIAPYPNAAMSGNIGKAAAGDGCRVVLNGEGGDEFLTGTPFHYQEDLTRGNWSALARSVYSDVRDLGPLITLWRIARYGLGPILPRQILDVRRKLRAKRRPSHFAGVRWLSEDMEARLALRRAEADKNEFSSIANFARRSMALCMTFPFSTTLWDSFARQRARDGYQSRSPMQDRRYTEFAFAIPEHMRLRGARAKYIHTRALTGQLPEIVARRQDKAEFSIAFERLIDGMEAHFTGLLAQQRPDIFDASGMSALFRFYQRGGHGEKPTWELWDCFSCANVLQIPSESTDSGLQERQDG